MKRLLRRARAACPRGHIIGRHGRKTNAIFAGRQEVFSPLGAAPIRGLAAIVFAIAGFAAVEARAQPPQRAPAGDRLAPLAFLLGEWDALPDGAGGRGSCTFALELQDRVIVRTNHAEAPAASGRPASVHDDLMVIYEEGAILKADYYDSEAHQIRYVVSAPGPNRVVLLADATAAAPGYRLTYWLEQPGIVRGQFEIAAPGKPGAFTTYLSWGMKRR